MKREGTEMDNSSTCAGISLIRAIEIIVPEPAFSPCMTYLNININLRFILAVMRDMKEWGRDLDQILNQYTQLVKPAFEEFCLPVSSDTIMGILTNMIYYKNSSAAKFKKIKFKLNADFKLICIYSKNENQCRVLIFDVLIFF